MKIVGITGGIASGKSLVSNILRNLKFKVYDSDYRAKYLMNHDYELVKSIKNHFGDNVYVNNKLNTNILSKIIFSDLDKINILNNLVHPKVEKDFNFFKLFYAKESLLFKEAAILYETKMYNKCDIVLVITANKKIRIHRIMNRNKISYQEVLKRMKIK